MPAASNTPSNQAANDPLEVLRYGG